MSENKEVEVTPKESTFSRFGVERIVMWFTRHGKIECPKCGSFNNKGVPCHCYANNQIVSANQKWILRGHDGDPFPAKGRKPVVILDVRNGWVRFDMGVCSPFRDERMEIKMFTDIYSLDT